MGADHSESEWKAKEELDRVGRRFVDLPGSDFTVVETVCLRRLQAPSLASTTSLRVAAAVFSVILLSVGSDESNPSSSNPQPGRFLSVFVSKRECANRLAAEETS